MKIRRRPRVSLMFHDLIKTTETEMGEKATQKTSKLGIL